MAGSARARRTAASISAIVAPRVGSSFASDSALSRPPWETTMADGVFPTRGSASRTRAIASADASDCWWEKRSASTARL